MPGRVVTVLLLLAIPALGQTTAPATTRPATAPANLPAPPPDSMGLDSLQALYRRELGDKYSADLAPKLYEAHLWMEKFFADDDPEDRKSIIRIIDRLGIDPNVLGRIARIRMNWPALETGVYYINDRLGPYPVHYFLGIPKDYDRLRSWPLVIKLAGAQPFTGKDAPGPDEVVRIYTAWINDELQRHPDAIVLIPLLNLTEAYGPSYPGMNSVIQAMHHAAGRANIDPARVYLLGHSMAAHAVWNLGLHYTTYFAAINPMAGAASAEWQRLRLRNLRNLLTVVWHDADDTVIKVESSRQLVAILRRFKYDVEYEETKNVGHAPSPDIAERCYQKLIARRRDLYPAEVPLRSNRPDTIFNRVDWVQVYQPLESGQERRYRFRRGTGTMVVTDNAIDLDALIKSPNHIEATTDNVEFMRFYLNDQMVDFAKPIVVSVNGRVRFDGLLGPSVEVMLIDQLLLGRGWRYFTAAVDVDFANPRASTEPTTRSKSEDLKQEAEELKKAMRRQETQPAERGDAPDVNR